jgi:hypothetical protein
MKSSEHAVNLGIAQRAVSARFLQQQGGDAEWERIIAARRRSYPGLQPFAADALREGAR